MASGILIIDKPSGWTSMDVCAKVRGLLHERRVGHGGTLDPMATGVLPVFVGQASKAAEYAENSRKEYVAGLRLGVVTDTQDITGNVLETRPVMVTDGTAQDTAGTDGTAQDVTAAGGTVQTITVEQVREALARFTGEISQIPPMYSAIKINGKKLYALARKGKEVERPARTVTIYELELMEAPEAARTGSPGTGAGISDADGPGAGSPGADCGQTGTADFRFRCVCSKGTYIRTLCHDIGAALGCGGTLYALRRTMAAGYRAEDAVTLDDVASRGADLLRPIDSLFARYPAYRLPTEGKERRVRNGGGVRAGVPDGLYRVYGLDGTFLCLSRAENGELSAVKNFFGG